MHPPRPMYKSDVQLPSWKGVRRRISQKPKSDVFWEVGENEVARGQKGRILSPLCLTLNSF